MTETGIAVLFVTHDLEEAALLSDRVVVLGGAPGHVIDEIPVDLAHDRDLETLRFDDGFRDLCRALQNALKRARGVSV